MQKGHGEGLKLEYFQNFEASGHILRINHTLGERPFKGVFDPKEIKDQITRILGGTSKYFLGMIAYYHSPEPETRWEVKALPFQGDFKPLSYDLCNFFGKSKTLKLYGNGSDVKSLSHIVTLMILSLSVI